MAVLRSRHTASPSGLGVPDAHLLGCFAQSLYVLFLVYFYFPKCVNTVSVSKGQVTFPAATNCPEQMPKSVLTFNVEISCFYLMSLKKHSGVNILSSKIVRRAII